MNAVLLTNMVSATEGFAYETEASMLKTAHFKSFSGKLMRVRIFILQIDNKIADVAEASEKRKIQYEMSLL